MKVFKNYNEDKKILKLKKDFTLKRETIVEEQKIVRDQINVITKKEDLERHITHVRDWKSIEEKIQQFKPYRDFLKTGFELETKENYGMIPFPEIKNRLMENGYTEKQFNKIFEFITNDWDMRKAFHYERYTNKVRISFHEEIAKMG